MDYTNFFIEEITGLRNFISSDDIDNDSQWFYEDDEFPYDDYDIFLEENNFIEKEIQMPTIENGSFKNISGPTTDSDKCILCCENQISIIFEKCFHVLLCEKCSVETEQCPICNKETGKKTKIFMV